MCVQHEPLDIAAELYGLQVDGAGAIATFTGIVRSDDGVTALTLEHYPGMTEAALREIAKEAADRWSLAAATIVHRVGRMVPGDPIVHVATAAPHRADALDACGYMIDLLKTGAPFWKREERGDASLWVEARAADDAAAVRWTT